jgi:hypothetical protein
MKKREIKYFSLAGILKQITFKIPKEISPPPLLSIDFSIDFSNYFHYLFFGLAHLRCVFGA